MNVQVNKTANSGFTLVELIAVIVITGIIAGMVAVFIRSPVQGYVDLARRAEMVDVADTALRRIGRDVRLALPNSVRVSADTLAIEFLEAPAGGRYRTVPDGGADELRFDQVDTTFDVLGPPVMLMAGNEIVVFNLGVPGADAYEGNTANTHVRRAYTGATGVVANVAINSAARLPLESPNARFHVVSGPVSYICDPVAGELRRYWGYAIQSDQPVTSTALNTLPGVASALIAKNVSACAFSYDVNVVAQRAGLITLRLAITQENENVRLYHAAHVNNIP